MYNIGVFMGKKIRKISGEIVAFFLVNILALIAVIISISFKEYYGALFISIAICLNLFLPLSVELIKNEKNSMKIAVFYTFLRFVMIINSAGIPCLLYYFVPFIKNMTNVGFLFASPVISIAYYMVIRTYYLIHALKDDVKKENNKEGQDEHR